MRKYNSAIPQLIIFSLIGNSANTFAQHDDQQHTIEEIIVTSQQQKTLAQTALPVTVLSGEELRKDVSGTLGDTLANQPGINSASFGTGVGQPVIRGLSGNRVAVLQNSSISIDASGASQDHASAIEPMLAERIEVIRGPATLLYGPTGFGGVVDVIDNRIPAAILPLETAIELRGGSAAKEKTLVVKNEGGGEHFAWHVNGVSRETDNLNIPGFALTDERLGELPEEEAAEIPNGYLDNSYSDAASATLGGSWIDGEDYFGIALQKVTSEYGLPPGVHEHHEDEGTEHEHEEEEEALIRLKMDTRRADMKAQKSLTGFFSQLSVDLSYNDYEHTELEGEEIGTRFLSEGIDSRVSLYHESDSASSLVGIQYFTRDFSALGEEAFIPEVTTDRVGIYSIFSYDINDFILETGGRYDTQNHALNSRQTCVSNAKSDYKSDAFSLSGSLLWQANSENNLFIALSRASRSPSSEELFSNYEASLCSDTDLLVEHAATARIEIGDPTLKNETANNLELGWKKHLGQWRADASVFYNKIDRFIFLNDIDEIDDTVVSAYQQQNARLYGYELQVSTQLEMGEQHLDIALFTDQVTGTFSNGESIPRMPANRAGFSLNYGKEAWSATFSLTHRFAQDRTAPIETETDAYTRIDLDIDYHWQIASSEVLLFLKAENLADEVIREHTSLLKDVAPQAGRGIYAGVRITF